MDRKGADPAKGQMIIVGPGGTTLDKGELEELMRTEAEALIRELAVEVWRMRRRFDRLPRRTQEEARTAGDSIGRLEDLLTQHDVRFTVHDGESYDPGLGVEVLEAQSDVAGGPPVIIETVRPTITWQGRVLCRAQVVVGGREPNA